MDADAWSRLSAASKRRQSALQQPFDLYFGFEDMEGEEEDSRDEFPCPFCDEDFDIVGLCRHMDYEHPDEAKNGICPICLGGVGMDMIGHITVQHANLFKKQHRRLRKGSSGSSSVFNFLKKELMDGNFQSLLGGTSSLFVPSQAAPDPLLSSFISNVSIGDSTREAEPESLDEEMKETSELKVIEREKTMKDSLNDLVISIYRHLHCVQFLSYKDQKEIAQRSRFVQCLVLSTIFDDVL